MDYFIFDMDGTMFDTENFYYQTWRDIAKKNNFSFDLEDKILLSGRKMDESISYMVEKFSMDRQKAVEIRKDLNDLREEKFEKIDYSLKKSGLVELLDYLKKIIRNLLLHLLLKKTG